jgi:phytanoyl-CoA hydroxylase
MYQINTHAGDTIDIPSTAAEDQPYFTQMDGEAIEYYNANGYVVLRGLLPSDACAAARATYAAQIKPYDGFIYRQTTAQAERHKFNAQGYVVNPVLNVQSVSNRYFAAFRAATLACLTHPRVSTALTALFGERPKIVQSMYFEGNTSTWPHQDTYYLDSEKLGEMCGAWFALEDIAPNAGRFFICPTSHKIDVETNGGDFDIAFNHERYKALMIDLMRDKNLAVSAPALREGDVLFWNAKTIHGSLESPDAQSSRQSLTAHYIPESSNFMQLQSRVIPLKLIDVGGVNVAMIKSQDVAANRAMLWFEGNFPEVAYPVKKLLVKAMLSWNRLKSR